MALNLSTLTNASTSGTVLTEALTTADFLDSVPILANLANRGNKGGDAKQTVGSNQPKALPLVNGSGYVYLPNVTGNAPAVDFPNVPSSTNYVLTIVADIQNPSNFHFVTGVNSAHRFAIFTNQFYAPNRGGVTLNSAITTGLSTFVIEGTGSAITLKQNGVTKATVTGSTNGFDVTHISFNGQYGGTSIQSISGLVKSVVLTVGGTESVNIDFTATNVRHGDTKFKCATGQVVTINQSGNDPATIIKKSVLRFDGVNNGLDGLFASSFDNGYMFAAFSVLGDGGENYARVFTTNESGQTDVVASSWIWSLRNATSTGIGYYNNGSFYQTHTNMYDDARGDYLHEHKVISGSQKSAINNADLKTTGNITSLVLDEFHIGASEIIGDNNAAIDLEYLALFPATITDDQADSVRNYINNRNNVFSLVDNGFYFFDPQSITDSDLSGATNRLTSSWEGRIVGSDNGDTSRSAYNGTEDDQPTSDKYTLTFADNTDNLSFSISQAGWQVVGTSLGTFAYRVNNTAVTELNLLGNLGHVSYRLTGDLFGIILLPESATGADIEEARKLLIDRGAADGATGGLFAAWFTRTDIVDFKYINASSVTTVASSFRNCTNLQNFPALDLRNANNFSYAWNGCAALTSFPAGAKLGTSANNVNFTSAFRDSGLTSFPADIDLSAGGMFVDTWRGTNLTSFSTPITGVNSKRLRRAWHSCTALTDFSYNVFANWNPSIILTQVFDSTWDGCTALTAQSVGNILQGIDASNQFATVDGNSGSAAIVDAGIDIDYNVATGSLSAATNSAIDSLSGKGWEVYINGVLVIPNILDLAPAAAYSLRSFDSAADPNVVNVRRSSDNATSDFKASEVSDGTLVAFVGAGNDGHVTTWYDQGGTNHATQSTASSQPKIVDGGTLVTEGGLPAVNFDGTDDHLFTNSAYPTSNNQTSFIAASSTTNNGRVADTRGTGQSGTLVGWQIKFSNTVDVDIIDSGASSLGTTNIIRTGQSLASSLMSLTELQSFTNGVLGDSQTGNLTTFNSGNPLYLGANVNGANSQLFNGLMQEVVLYNTDQSANRTGIENNINDHFDIY